MMKTNDPILSHAQLKDIRAKADRLLREAGAYGSFPTPVANIMNAAKVHLDEQNSLDSNMIHRLYRKATDVIKHALDKVLGIFDVRANTIYYDHSIHKAKKPFLLLHETGHSYLDWQKATYAFLEDGKGNLEPEVSEAFECEANVFASEVLFQVDKFTTLAEDMPLALATPMSLAQKFGASIYSSVRRFATTTSRCCVILVLEPPLVTNGVAVFALRRPLPSKSFLLKYGDVVWQPDFSRLNFPSRALPHIGRSIQKVVKPAKIEITIAEEKHRFTAEAFNSTQNVFLLLYPESQIVSAHT
jgi:Zn-dependent peptidase ImmA (M78 family)